MWTIWEQEVMLRMDTQLDVLKHTTFTVLNTWLIRRGKRNKAKETGGISRGSSHVVLWQVQVNRRKKQIIIIIIIIIEIKIKIKIN